MDKKMRSRGGTEERVSRWGPKGRAGVGGGCGLMCVELFSNFLNKTK